MAKNGKFANGNAGNDSKEGINNAAISAVIKMLDTLTISIRHTIDSGFNEVKEVMKINPNSTPVTSEDSTSTK